jgi:hypothetical protein
MPGGPDVYEDLAIEMSRLERAALAKARERIADQQRGELFRDLPTHLVVFFPPTRRAA